MFIRHLISENREGLFVIRQYEVEMTPEGRELLEYGHRAGPRLANLELRISEAAADYFKDVPYLLADTIWRQGFMPYCIRPFCCCDYPVLHYRHEPQVRAITDMGAYKAGPIVLVVLMEWEEQDW